MIDKIVLPYRGEFGHRLMWHYASVHGLEGSKLVFGEKGEHPFFPSAVKFIEVPIMEDRLRRQHMRHDREFMQECADSAKRLFPEAEVIWPKPREKKFFIPEPGIKQDICCDVVLPPRKRVYGNARNWDQWALLIEGLRDLGLRVFLVGAPESSYTNLGVPAAWDYEDFTSATIEALRSSSLCVCTDTGVGYLALWCAVPVLMITYRNGATAPGFNKHVSVKRFQAVNHTDAAFELVHGSWEDPARMINRVKEFIGEIECGLR